MITENELKSLAAADQFIALIKEYRTATGEGLKESKEAIETCFFYPAPDLRKIDQNKILRLFAPYLPPTSPINQTITQEKAGENYTELKNAIACVFANYKKLGYKSPHVLLQTVLNNYSTNP